MSGVRGYRAGHSGKAALADAFVAGFSLEPVIALDGGVLEHRETAILVRLGDGEPLARDARNRMREHLQGLIRPFIDGEARYCITTMPARCDQEREHTFVSFTRSLADALGIECVNDRFLERRPRPDVTQVAGEDRYEGLRDNWYFNGSLEGRTVILLDDVINTGSSVRAAAQCLRNAGAEVIPVVLMWSPDEDEETERVLHKYFDGHWENLLALEEVWGSLRESVQAWANSGGDSVRDWG